MCLEFRISLTCFITQWYTFYALIFNRKFFFFSEIQHFYLEPHKNNLK